MYRSDDSKKDGLHGDGNRCSDRLEGEGPGVAELARKEFEFAEHEMFGMMVALTEFDPKHPVEGADREGRCTHSVREWRCTHSVPSLSCSISVR